MRTAILIVLGLLLTAGQSHADPGLPPLPDLARIASTRKAYARAKVHMKATDLTIPNWYFLPYSLWPYNTIDEQPTNTPFDPFPGTSLAFADAIQTGQNLNTNYGAALAEGTVRDNFEDPRQVKVTTRIDAAWELGKPAFWDRSGNGVVDSKDVATWEFWVRCFASQTVKVVNPGDPLEETSYNYNLAALVQSSPEFVWLNQEFTVICGAENYLIVRYNHTTGQWLTTGFYTDLQGNLWSLNNSPVIPGELWVHDRKHDDAWTWGVYLGYDEDHTPVGHNSGIYKEDAASGVVTVENLVTLTEGWHN